MRLLDSSFAKKSTSHTLNMEPQMVKMLRKFSKKGFILPTLRILQGQKMFQLRNFTSTKLLLCNQCFGAVCSIWTLSWIGIIWERSKSKILQEVLIFMMVQKSVAKVQIHWEKRKFRKHVIMCCVESKSFTATIQQKKNQSFCPKDLQVSAHHWRSWFSWNDITSSWFFLYVGGMITPPPLPTLHSNILPLVLGGVLHKDSSVE